MSFEMLERLENKIAELVEHVELTQLENEELKENSQREKDAFQQKINDLEAQCATLRNENDLFRDKIGAIFDKIKI